MRTHYLFILFFIFALSFNGHRKVATKTTPWVACVDSKSNSIAFSKLGVTRKKKGRCVSKIRYKVPKNLEIIENLSSSFLEGDLIPGTKRTLLSSRGRRLSISQWTDHKKAANYLVVLEPNLESKKITKHCVLKNHGPAYSTKFDKKGRLLVQVQSKKKKKWKVCSL